MEILKDLGEGGANCRVLSRKFAEPVIKNSLQDVFPVMK